MPEGGLVLDSVFENKELIDFSRRLIRRTRATRGELVQIWYRFSIEEKGEPKLAMFELRLIQSRPEDSAIRNPHVRVLFSSGSKNLREREHAKLIPPRATPNRVLLETNQCSNLFY